MSRADLFLTIVFIIMFTNCDRSKPFSIDESIQGGMEKHKVPGISIAFINNYRIEWDKGYGVVEAGRDEPVTTKTLFQPGSIGKPLTALTALHFVEAGLLDLDADVNDYLVSWKLPENEFTVKEKVTLRRLLSHSGGVTVSGFRGYAEGEEIPSLQQILDGKEPANNSPIRVDIVPGTEWRYSGGGYMVVQQLLEDVMGRSFPEIMREIVLEPVGMTSSVYSLPLPEELHSMAATAHDASGQPSSTGKWHELACMGAGGGMWTTSSDLALFAIDIMLSINGKSNRVLSQDMANQMLTPQMNLKDQMHMGLGFLVQDEGRDLIFGHNGSNEPGFRSLLLALPERGQGVVIMTNGANGEILALDIASEIIEEYDWPNILR
jgi:CubicO group peptidase (beta-lactamase class C family)